MKNLTSKLPCSNTWDHLRKILMVMKMMVFLIILTTTELFAVESNAKDLLGESQSTDVVQQEKTITGTASDENGNPLAGVTVIVKGTTTGAITDMNGAYEIRVPDDAEALIFQFVGMMTQEVAIGDNTRISVTMETDVLGLEEVIVVGYGVQKKETLTGSIVSVDGDDLQRDPNANILTSLQGRLPGLISNQRSGKPGQENMEVLIRGKGTFGNNQPLVIIDGVERDHLGRLNAEDIESITVLKDASAAIYGARSANGVILVTTKHGQISKPQFSATYNHHFAQPTVEPNMMESWQFAQVVNEKDWYAQGRPEEYTPYYSDEEIQKFKDGTDPVLYPNTNWSKELTKPFAQKQRASMQVTGGTDNVRYLLSFSGLNQGGNYKHGNETYKQYNLRAKIDVSLTDNLTAGVNVNAIPHKFEGSGGNFWQLIRGDPTYVGKYPNGLPGPGRLGGNPMMGLQGSKYWTETLPLFTTFTASYKVPFVEGLQIDGSYNYDYSSSHQHSWSVPRYYYEYNALTGEYVKGTTWRGAGQGELSETYRRSNTSLFNYRISYEKAFGDHFIKAMVGQEQQQNYSSYVSAFRKNYVSGAIDQIDIGSNAAADKNNSGSASRTGYNNYFGRLNYDYQAKYLAEFLFRRDGSQIFPEGKRYGFFPGFSLGWRLSEEDFIKNATSAINQLKLRFSYGQIGNDRVGQYQYLQAFQFGNNMTFGTSLQPGIYSSRLPNPNITWEVSKKTDIGVDAALWNHLLGFEITLWKENRSNILASRNLSVPAIAGFPALPDENIGEVDNKGFEFLVRHRNSRNRFTYNIEGNIAFARSKIVFMDETPNAEPYQDRTGLPVGAALYYEADGIFRTEEELDAYPHRPDQQVGDVRLIDLNGDGQITSADQFRFDLTATPEVVFGLSFGGGYGPLDFNILFQGQTRAYNYDPRFADLGTVTGTIDNGYYLRFKDHWTVDNPDGAMPRASQTQSTNNNTFWLMDATFVRLKNLEIGYTLPSSLTSRARLGSARIYLNGFNLLTWAKEIKYIDPELSGEALYYPQQRIMNFGINLTF